MLTNRRTPALVVSDADRALFAPQPPAPRPNPDADPALAGFREALRGHRQRLGWSQEGAAAMCDMDHSLVSRIESGHRNPTRAAIAKLATGLRLTPAERDHLLVSAMFRPEDPAALLADEAVVARLYQVLRHGGLAGGIAEALRGAVAHATALAVATVDAGKE
jgi:transcriptional regulator with XRE-family HTH domain